MSNTRNKLTVITCSKSDLLGLRITLRSLLQVKPNSPRCLVIASGYPQKELSVLREEFSDLNLEIKVSNKDGIYEAMNLGLEQARTEYVIFINGGDQLESKGGLEKLVREMNGRSWGYGSLLVNSGTGQNKVYQFKPYRKLLHRMGIKYCPHPSCVIKRETAINLGGFNTKYKIAADQDLLIKFAKLELPLVSKQQISRFVRGGVSTRSSHEINQDFKNISRENFGFFFKSALIDALIWKILGVARNLLS